MPDIDDTPLKFGKYRGYTPNEIAEKDPKYIVWAFENLDTKPCSKDLYKCCELDEGDWPDFCDAVQEW